MASLLNNAFSLLLGLALAGYGLVHTLTSYPDPATLDRLAVALPSVGAALVFAAGVLAVAVGLWLAASAAARARRSWRQLRRPAGPRSFPANGRPPYDGGGGGYGDGSNGYHPDPDEREWAGAYR